MSQHDMDIANALFPTLRADVNAALQALASLSSGSSRPSTVYTNQLWMKNVSATQNEIYIWDGTDDILLATVNFTTNVVTFKNTFALKTDVETGTDETLPVNAKILLETMIQQGKHGIFIPAGSMTVRTTNGPEAGTAESSTNKVMTDYLAFDQSTAEYAQFMQQMPKNWNLGTVTAVFWWTAPSGAGDVVWGIQAVALSDDDVLDAAFGTAQTVTDTLTNVTDVMRSPETSAMTIAGTPAANDLVVFQVYRNAASGSDTFNADARLLGVYLYASINARNEA